MANKWPGSDCFLGWLEAVTSGDASSEEAMAHIDEVVWPIVIKSVRTWWWKRPIRPSDPCDDYFADVWVRVRRWLLTWYVKRTMQLGGTQVREAGESDGGAIEPVALSVTEGLIYKVAWRCAEDEYWHRQTGKVKGPRGTLSLDEERGQLAEHAGQDSMERNALSSELSDALKTCMAKLPPKQAKVIQMHLNGMAGNEIARYLGVHPSQVTRRAQAAREALHRCLARQGLSIEDE